MDFDKLLKLYLDYHRSLFHTEKTIKGYSEILIAFFSFCRINGIVDLSSDTFFQYQLYLVDKGLRSASVDSYLRHIKAFVHWLSDSGHIEDNELYRSIKLPKLEKKNVLIYTPDEISMIYDAVSSKPEWINCRDKLIISLMYDSGLRQAEVCKISRSDFDTDRLLLHVHGKGNKDRIVPIGRITLLFAEKYLSLCPYSGQMLLLNRRGGVLSPNTVKLFVSKIQQNLDFELSSHRLRHNFATNYLIDQYEKFGYFDAYSLMILLGHEDISTTDRYLHLAKQYIASKQRTSHLDIIYKNMVSRIVEK